MLLLSVNSKGSEPDTISVWYTRNSQLSALLDSITVEKSATKKMSIWNEYDLTLKQSVLEDSLQGIMDSIIFIRVSVSYRNKDIIPTDKIEGCIINNGGYFFLYNQDIDEEKIKLLFTKTTNFVILPRIHWDYYDLAIHEKSYLFMYGKGKVIDFKKQNKYKMYIK